MVRGFETGSDNEKIDELQKQLDDINDSQINAIGGNENISIDSTRGQRNSASGDAGGIRSNEPIIHNITDVDEDDVSTGVFDKINIISSMAIIEHTATPIVLRFIQGTIKDGARIKITPKMGKTIDVESGGNILTSSTITITDTDFYELVKYSEAETGVTGGAFKIFLTGAGGSGGVSFPIDFPEEQRGTVGFTTEIIDFTQSDRHYVIMELNGDIGLSLINTTATKGQITSIKLKQDGTGGHAFIGFSQPVGNEQVIIDAVNDNNAPNGFTEFVVEFTDGIFTAYLKTGNIVGEGGGGSLSEPIELGFNEAVTQTLPTLTTIAGDVFNPTHVTLDKDIGLSLVVSATTAKYKSIFVIFDTLGNGFTVTWPVSVVNPPTIDDSVAQRISVILYTIDNGTLWTHATSVGSSSGAEFFGPWTALHDAGVQSLTNLAAAAFVDTGGLPRGTIFGDAGNSALGISLPISGKLQISQVITPILEIDDTTGLTMLGSHVINMGNNVINTVSEVQFSNANIHTPSNELSIAFDTADNALKYSVPLTTNLHMFFADTDLLATFTRVGSNEGLLSIQAVTAAFLQATETLFLSTFNNTSPTNGDVWRDSGDGKFKFRENSITQELGGLPNEIFEGDSFVRVIDAGTGVVITFVDNAQRYSIQATRADYNQIPVHGITEIHMDDTGANNISILTASASGLLLNILSAANFYDIQIDSTDAFHIDDFRTRILSTSPNITDPEFSLFRDDPSPTSNSDVGTIVFEGRNSAAQLIRYGSFSVGSTNVTDTTETAVLVANIFDNGLSVQQFRLEDGALRIRKFSGISSDVAALNLEKEDGSPSNNDSVAEINFNINDSGVVTTYGSISVTAVDITDNAAMTFNVRADNGLISAMVLVGDDNNQRFQMLMSGTSQFRIQPVFDRMGYFVTPQVTDFTLVLGTNGSLQIPQFTDGSPSINDLQQAAGSFDGAIVHDKSSGTLYIRNNSGQFDAYARTGTVV